MKKMKYIYFLCLTVLSACFVACNDDDNHDSTPITVTQVYLEDYNSTVPDRPVTFARLGQLIRLEGSGFLGMKKVYINGYDTYFNQTYVSDNSMLIQINSKTPVIDAEEDDRDKIRLVKSGTDYVLDFTIRASSPTVSGMSNTLPQAGETVYVYGTNLHETTQVTLPGGQVVSNVTSHIDGEWYSFEMPAGVVSGSGSVYSEGAHGTAATPAYFNFREGMLLDWDGTGTPGAWSWSETGSMIGVSGDQNDLVADPLDSGRGTCLPLIPARMRVDGIAAGKPRASEAWTSGTGNEMDDWTRLYPLIPAATPLTEVAFQFDIYVPEAWSATGHIEIVLYNNFNFNGIGGSDDGGRTAFYVPYIQNGAIVPFRTAGWQTVTIPFSEFGYYAKILADAAATDPTFQTVVDDRLAATYQNFGMGFVNTDFSYGGVDIASTLFNQEIYIDNWRIVPCASVAISDFGDEEED